MRSYLSLVPISAKVHKRRNRMTLLCIMIAVFLVTAVFSALDMSVRGEKNSLIQKHGNWHVQLLHISEADAEKIGSRSDVSVMSRCGVINYEREEEYRIEEKKAVLYGVDEAYITDINDCLSEGTFPENEKEIILSPNAKEIFDAHIGGSVRISAPFGDMDYIVCGFGEHDAEYNRLYDTVSVYMDRSAFDKLCGQDGGKDIEPSYYIRFKDYVNISKSIENIKEQYGLTDENIDENTAILSFIGYSRSAYVKNLYFPAAVLAVVIMLAGVLMISGSMNSSIAERSKFFGMLRCLGASREQIIRFVRLEALSWCKTAVPAGILLGTVFTWVLCAVLKFGIKWEFANIPLFGLSKIGIITGIAVGIMTVLIAAQAPAKRASKVSPVEAVSGSAEGIADIYRARNMKFFKIETFLGIHHALSVRKNLVLMTGSFALSIILLLAFSAGLDLVQALIPNIRPWQPDFTITAEGGFNSVDRNLADEIDGKPGVKHVFGNMAVVGVPAVSGKDVDKITLVSYDKFLLECARDSTADGDLSKVNGDSDYVLTIYNRDNPLKTGDRLQIYGTTVEVAGTLSDGLFQDEITLICSEETFMRLTGESDYAMLNVQFSGNASDEDIDEIRSLIGGGYILGDNRASNRMIVSEYWAFRILVYGFLMVIALITVLNIMNSTSMSVSARMKQYGAMRAIGMDGRQLTKMVAAETFTFAFCGCIVGGVFGLLFHRYIYVRLITAYFGESWRLPVMLLIVILFLVLFTTAAAVYAPAKRMRKMAITDVINEL